MPTTFEVQCERRSRASTLRRYPRAEAASFTRCEVRGATWASALRAREAVLRLTPAASATWRSVGRSGLGRGGLIAVSFRRRVLVRRAAGAAPEVLTSLSIC